MTQRVMGIGFGLLLLLFQIGCGDTSAPLPSSGPSGGPRFDEPCSDEGAPLVTVLLPTAASDPNTDEIVTSPALTVQCEVTATGAQIDETSVAIQVADDFGTTDEPIVVDNGDGTFSGAVDLSAFANGVLTVGCQASDTASRPLCGSDVITTFLDLGPGVEILSPEDNSLQAGGMIVQYRLSNLPVSEADNMAGITNHTLVVAGAMITDVMQEGSEFIGTIDFSDPLLYQTALNGDYQLSVSATNQRGVTRTVTYGFTADAGGPTIRIIEPKLASIITGATNVIAEITDPSGIDDTTVRFLIDGEYIDMAPISGTSQYTGTFDANQYPREIGQVTIDITASDLVGNDRTESVSVQLDSQPPLIDMDPPTVREGKEEQDGVVCSTEFDPVGAEAASDQTVLGPAPRFRARIEDRTNRISAIFGVDGSDVQVYVLDDESQALLIDTDGDTICDSINPDFMPNNPLGNNPAVVIDLTPVPVTGTPFYLKDIILPPPYDSMCFGGPNDNGTGTATKSPDAVCIDTFLTRVIPDNTDPVGSREAIFGRAPLTSLRCIGDRFDFLGAGINPGYACVATRATDRGGNESVSSPLRVCFDDWLAPSGECPSGIGGTFSAFFSCTDGCSVSELDFSPGERIGPFL